MLSYIFSFDDSSSKVKILFVLGFLGLFVGIGLFIHLNLPLSERNKHSFLGAVLDHQDYLMRTQKNNKYRILLMGGSSLGFSVSAKYLSATLKKPVYNLGVHAGIGYENIWELYKGYLKPKKDLIVLSPEYGLLKRMEGATQKLCDIVFISKSFSMIWNFPACLMPVIFRSLQDIRYSLSSAKKCAEPYCRSAFNEFGDVTSHLTLKNIVFKPSNSQIFTSITEKNIDSYIKFVQRHIIAKGYQVVIIPTIIPKTTCGKNINKLEYIYNRLKVLNTVKNLALPKPTYCLLDELFFDTIYHLNAKGRAIKTSIVLEYLR